MLTTKQIHIMGYLNSFDIRFNAFSGFDSIDCGPVNRVVFFMVPAQKCSMLKLEAFIWETGS